MSAAVIAEGLSKIFSIKSARADGRLVRTEKVALDDVSFEVKEGEVLGIIGRNGAGKSTLLKILSRITTPTKGHAIVCGRVASLLEVGTGMHPEMTGRENIFLNGALLGMHKSDIARHLEEIIEFSGVTEYLDTPIKRYSSGMKLRLAFAVAAHLSADVMIVDEVLAVGDAEFQAKCMGVMQNGTRTGRTTLFVSHNMAAVENLCSRVIWLENGKIMNAGPAGDLVSAYLQGAVGSGRISREFEAQSGNGHNPVVHFLRASISNTDGKMLAQGDDILINLEVEVHRQVKGLQILISITTLSGNPICAVSNGDYKDEWNLEPGTYSITAHFNSVRLMPQTHRISVRSFTGWGADTFEEWPDALTFHVQGRDVLGTGMLPRADRGVTWFPSKFRISTLSGQPR
jgi:homopolymeric O-antigen transport system ATP-binding protein